VKVRHLKSVQSSNSVVLMFEVTNHTAGRYLVMPASVEVRNGAVWSRVVDLNPPSTPSTPLTPPRSYFLSPRAFMSFTLEVTNLPTAYPVRLKLHALRERGQLEGLLVRFRLRAFEGQKFVSVNPFDKSVSFFAKPTPILSDEFVEQEEKSGNEGNSEK